MPAPWRFGSTHSGPPLMRKVRRQLVIIGRVRDVERVTVEVPSARGVRPTAVWARPGGGSNGQLLSYSQPRRGRDWMIRPHTFASRAATRGMSIVADPPAGVVVEADPRALGQTIANLLDNALKHTPAGGAIRLAARTGLDGRAEFAVSDTGPGIPPEERTRVLERFARLDNSRSTRGSGLGLSQVAATARLHDADLTLEDAKPGLRVLLRFPAPRPA